MGEHQREAEPHARRQRAGCGNALVDACDDKCTFAIQPSDMRKDDDAQQESGDPRLGMEERCARAQSRA